jgi:hypothetical protein
VTTLATVISRRSTRVALTRTIEPTKHDLTLTPGTELIIH